MDRTAPPFSVVTGAAQSAPSGQTVDSPRVPPLAQFDAQQKLVWKYICESLAASGLDHITAGLPIAVIVRTYTDWLAAVKVCEEKKTRYQTSNNGWVSEAPWAADERRLKSELAQWLPKACLTIPSALRAKKDSGVESGQDDLFDAFKNHGKDRPASNG